MNRLSRSHLVITFVPLSAFSIFKIAKLKGNSEEIVRKHYAKLLSVDSRDNIDF